MERRFHADIYIDKIVVRLETYISFHRTADIWIALNRQVIIYFGGKKNMARISGVDLPREKRVEIGLTYIYGIGLSSAKRILAEANVDPDTRVRDLTDDEVKRISAVINDTQVVEGDLRREIALNIKRLKEIGCYRGKRHRQGLPCRGQKTKTNARTRKGPKKTVANKKK